MAKRTIDAVVPVAARDLERLTLLLIPSLREWFEPLGTLWVVTPDDDYHRTRTLLRRHHDVEVAPESALVPELRIYGGATGRAASLATSLASSVLQSLHALPRAHRPNYIHSGWYRQQLVKLSFAEWTDTAFYLCLDADVIAVRPTTYNDLIRDDRGLAQPGGHAPEEWPLWARQILGVETATREFDVTPVLLAADAVHSLADEIEGLRHPFLARIITRVLNAVGPRLRTWDTWQSKLIWELPWTEYGLYFTYLEGRGLFDRYHFVQDDLALHGNSVWAAVDWNSWEPSRSFENTAGDFFFTVIQSNHQIPAPQVAARLSGYAPWRQS